MACFFIFLKNSIHRNTKFYFIAWRKFLGFPRLIPSKLALNSSQWTQKLFWHETYDCRSGLRYDSMMSYHIYTKQQRKVNPFMPISILCTIFKNVTAWVVHSHFRDIGPGIYLGTQSTTSFGYAGGEPAWPGSALVAKRYPSFPRLGWKKILCWWNPWVHESHVI